MIFFALVLFGLSRKRRSFQRQSPAEFCPCWKTRYIFLFSNMYTSYVPTHCCNDGIIESKTHFFPPGFGLNNFETYMFRSGTYILLSNLFGGEMLKITNVTFNRVRCMYLLFYVICIPSQYHVVNVVPSTRFSDVSMIFDENRKSLSV